MVILVGTTAVKKQWEMLDVLAQVRACIIGHYTKACASSAETQCLILGR